MKLSDAMIQYKRYDEVEVERIYREGRSFWDGKIIVLDDDPTGIQTVNGVYVYTAFDYDTILEAFHDGNRVSYILTDSRGLTEEETTTLHREIALLLKKASACLKIDYLLISRSDSTLRGHYPAEMDVLSSVLGPFDGEILVPFFAEGGRYTLGDVHYVERNGFLVPAGETEFARDKTFGYRESNLKSWIEEKTKGSVKRDDVTSVSLEMLRSLDRDGISEMLSRVEKGGKVIVNAVSYSDLKVFVSAFFKTMGDGKRFLVRSAASFVKTAGYIPDKPLLEREELVSPSSPGGLVVAGSHVDVTTRQINVLLSSPRVVGIEFNQHLALKEGGLETEAERVRAEAERVISSGRTALVYTRRQRLDFNSPDKEDELRLSRRISKALTSVVAHLSVEPGFIVAKGGITSSEIGTEALGVRKALVLGQIEKGIPVWKTGEESLFPGIPYVIFPGNVGKEDTLLSVVSKLEGERH
ncbi:MAG: four-carbon acid sugar kinase family protein [Candidatus Ornithospirochaeta sp.]